MCTYEDAGCHACPSAPSLPRPPFRALPSALICSLALLLCAAPSFADTTPWDANAQGQFITSLCRDTHGNVWIGTEDQGVWRCNPSAPKDKQYTHFTSADGLGDDNAYALACDKSGRVWAGTLNHGVSVYNGKAWKTYGPLNGPLGCRVFALAVSPRDGGVWGATEAGLFCYRANRWTYYTRADGLPSDQASSLAFSSDGLLYVGTQSDGIAVGSPDTDYRTWRTVPGPSQLPSVPAGKGLPSSLINCLLVASDNTIYAGTTGGLAKSRDGDTWTFVRGANWKDKLAGLYHPVIPNPAAVAGDLLTEDYVTCLTEDEKGRIFVGHRQKGIEVLDPKTGKRVQSGVNGERADDYVSALLADGKTAFVGLYGGGLFPPTGSLTTDDASMTSAVAAFPAFPDPAKPPTQPELTAMLTKVKSLTGEMPVGGGAYLGEDWQTQGDWVGRYGRQYALLCAMQSPWSDHIPIGCPLYAVRANIGPHRTSTDFLRSWVHWVQTDNPRSLYDPEIGYRRQAEHDDHGETYSPSFEGPDIWYALALPPGLHRISLYFMNKDGHDGTDRNRDYLIQIKPYRNTLEEAQTLPDLADARVHDFWGGVYKQFMLRGPSRYYVKIAKNNSFNTIVSAVMIDKMKGVISEEEDMQTIWLGKVRYDAPDPGPQPFTPTLTAARTLWGAMDALYDQPNALASETRYRIFAYRSVVQEQNAQELLKNWRWNLNLWSATDRNDFREAMTRARTSLLRRHPEFKALNN